MLDPSFSSLSDADLSVRRILTRHDLARITGKSLPTIDRWRRLGLLPPQVKYGPRTVGWPRVIIEKWLAEKEAAAQAPDLAQTPEPQAPELQPSKKTAAQTPEPGAPEVPKAPVPSKIFSEDGYEIPIWHPLYQQSGGES